jgi:hypothetical protein
VVIKVVLLVTLILPGQIPYAFQIDNMTKLHCDIAKEQLQKEYEQKFPKLAGMYSIICLDRDIQTR